MPKRDRALTDEEYLQQPVEIEPLLKRMEFDEDDVVTAATEQPKLFLDLARYRIQKMHSREAVKMALEVKEAEAAQRIRSSGEKVTEASVKEQIALDRTVHKHRLELLSVEELEEYSKLMLEAGRMRRDAIKVVVEHESSEAMMGIRLNEAVTQDASRKKLREQIVDLRRKSKGRDIQDESE